VPDSTRAPVSGICRRSLRGLTVIVWRLRARCQRERQDSYADQKTSSHDALVFDFVNQNTGRSPKLRWPLASSSFLPLLGVYGVRKLFPV
jgi:hypothetical protein